MKIGRKFPKVKPSHWKLRKARAAFLNRRQDLGDTDPEWTPYIEIYTGEDWLILTEGSTAENQTFIIAES